MNPIQQAINALRIVAESGKFQCHDDRSWDVINDALTSLRSLNKEVEGVEPVAAQHRFRHPQKGTPDWSEWQPCKVANRRVWEIDSQGYEVEYRALYTAIAAALGRERVPSGWKLVPVEPCDLLLNSFLAGYGAMGGSFNAMHLRDRARRGYRQMLEAVDLAFERGIYPLEGSGDE